MGEVAGAAAGGVVGAAGCEVLSVAAGGVAGAAEVRYRVQQQVG